MCPPGTMCSGECVDITSDAKNCGSCGSQCGAEAICANGECVCGGQTPGLCSGFCKDLAVDPQNCGACGAICPPNVVCSGGACVCPAAQLCGGQCVDIVTDPSNCGGCGVQCGASGVCVDSACHAVVTLDAEMGAGGEGYIIADATNVHWTTGDGVRRVPVAGGQGTTLSIDPATSLAQDASYVYWTTYTGNTLMRASKIGAPNVTTLAQGLPGPRRLTIDGSTLYWIDGNGVGKMSSAPGSIPSYIAPNAYVQSDIAVDATNLYWATNNAELIQWDKTTHATVTLANKISALIALRGSAVYLSGLEKITSIWKLSPDCVGLMELASGVSGGFAVDSSAVYFKVEKAVMRVSKQGGAAVLIKKLADGPLGPSRHDIAVDATYVYWIEGDKLIRYTK